MNFQHTDFLGFPTEIETHGDWVRISELPKSKAEGLLWASDVSELPARLRKLNGFQATWDPEFSVFTHAWPTELGDTLLEIQPGTSMSFLPMARTESDWGFFSQGFLKMAIKKIEKGE
jgi:hypothetical protein